MAVPPSAPHLGSLGGGARAPVPLLKIRPGLLWNVCKFESHLIVS